MKDMFVVSMLFVENVTLSGGAYLSYAATDPGDPFRKLLMDQSGGTMAHFLPC